MSPIKRFECEECHVRGKIVIETEDRAVDCVYCPICSADIYAEESDEDD